MALSKTELLEHNLKVVGNNLKSCQLFVKMLEENIQIDPNDEFSKSVLPEARKLFKECDTSYTKLLAQKEKMEAKK
jgi:hypothetical protein